MIELMRRIAENPYLGLLAGVVLLATSGYEIVDRFDEHRLGAHHGLFVFSMIHILRALPEVVEGAEEVSKLDRTRG
ncbi:hypothetical protein ACQUQP_01040 [Marinobacterium sp. YM272]|uniref:hypothetical protein n=1 Tax=Marinobacterium sp. YM272 TaxID=3421654 RepID=UPI003D7F8B5B